MPKPNEALSAGRGKKWHRQSIVFNTTRDQGQIFVFPSLAITIMCWHDGAQHKAVELNWTRNYPVGVRKYWALLYGGTIRHLCTGTRKRAMKSKQMQRSSLLGSAGPVLAWAQLPVPQIWSRLWAKVSGFSSRPSWLFSSVQLWSTVQPTADKTKSQVQRKLMMWNVSV